MIDNIYSTCPEILISCPQTSYAIPQSTSGVVRYSTTYGTGKLEVAGNGNDWYQVSGGIASIQLAPHVQAVINWAQTKMFEESRNKELCERYPEIQDSKNQFDNIIAVTQKLEAEKAELEKLLGYANISTNKVSMSLAKLTDEHAELVAKHNTWTVIANP